MTDVSNALQATWTAVALRLHLSFGSKDVRNFCLAPTFLPLLVYLSHDPELLDTGRQTLAQTLSGVKTAFHARWYGQTPRPAIDPVEAAHFITLAALSEAFDAYLVCRDPICHLRVLC